ncbi:MAG: hypothetical protein Q9209_001210 [Squamulea sp. 1 TL-2023]
MKAHQTLNKVTSRLKKGLMGDQWDFDALCLMFVADTMDAKEEVDQGFIIDIEEELAGFKRDGLPLGICDEWSAKEAWQYGLKERQRDNNRFQGRSALSEPLIDSTEVSNTQMIDIRDADISFDGDEDQEVQIEREKTGCCS